MKQKIEEPKKVTREPKWKDVSYKAPLTKIDNEATEFYSEKTDTWFRIINPKNLSIERLEAFEERSYQYAMVKDFGDIISDVTKIYDLSENGTKHADIRVISFNLLYSMANVKARTKFAFQLCSTFIVSENDDETSYSESIANKNIQVWKKEFENDFFLRCASNTLGGYEQLALHILRAYLGREAMEHFLNQSRELTSGLIDFAQPKEA